MAFPCGRCDACRENRRRIWTHRIMLESFCWRENVFLSLTYNDKHLPHTEEGFPTLDKRDLQLFLKRLRERYKDRTLRFFAVGEYGDRTFRPHYHAAIFNLPMCMGWPFEVVVEKGKRSIICRCDVCSNVRAAWARGHITCGEVTIKSARYMSGYVVKKLTKPTPELGGRLPEFARMSLRPGVGAMFIPDVASAVMLYQTDQKDGDVPIGLRHGSKVLPMGRYLRRLLREQVGLPPDAPDHVIEALRQGLLPVFEYARSVTPKGAPGVFKSVAKETFRELNEQGARNMKAKRLVNRKGKL